MKQVALGYNYLLLLTRAGQVYSMGMLNTFGQLGHGHTNPVYLPKQIEGLKKHIIIEIQCG